ERDFGGQRFVRHIAAEATWRPWRASGFEARDLGIGDATDGLAGGRGVRARDGGAAKFGAPSGEFLFFFVLSGELRLDMQGHQPHRLKANDSCVIPADATYAFDAAPGTELLEIALPADLS